MLAIKYDKINNNLDSFYSSIRTSKQQKINKLVTKQSKKQSILGEYLLKELIEENYHVPYETLKFKYNNYGKPYIIDKDIFFNISHSSDYAVCIISDKECGIDIEKIKPINLKILNTIATNNEMEYILSNKKEKYKRCFEIYCLKEAYFKMTGLGIQDFKRIECNINNKNIYCSDNNATLYLDYSLKNYIIAYAIKNEA